MVESDVFGPNVYSNMNGSHYVRSVKGMFSLYRAMRRLQWESFFTQNEYTQYTIGIDVIKGSKEAVAEKDKRASSTKIEDWMEKCEPLRTDFDMFISEGRTVRHSSTQIIL